MEGSDVSVGADRVTTVTTSIAHRFGMAYLRRYLEGQLAAVFIGSPHTPLGAFDSYMSKMNDMSDLEQRWTATDQQACLFLSAYDHKTRFALSEGY